MSWPLVLSVLILAGPGEEPGIAVTDLKAIHGIENSLAEALNEILLASLKESGRFESVLGGSDIRAMVSLEQHKASLGCDDTSCLAQLGGALGVPLLAKSTLSKVGGHFVLTLKILAVDEASVKVRLVKTVTEESALIGALQGMVPQAVAQLFMEEKKETSLAKTAPRPAAIAAPAMVVPTSKKRRWPGLVVSALGVASIAMAFATRSAAQSEFDQNKSVVGWDASGVAAQEDRAIGFWFGGLAASGLGLVMTVTALP